MHFQLQETLKPKFCPKSAIRRNQLLVHLWICGRDAGTSGSPAAVRGGFATHVLRLGIKDENDQLELRHNSKGIPVHCVKWGASLKQPYTLRKDVT